MSVILRRLATCIDIWLRCRASGQQVEDGLENENPVFMQGPDWCSCGKLRNEMPEVVDISLVFVGMQRKRAVYSVHGAVYLLRRDVECGKL